MEAKTITFGKNKVLAIYILPSFKIEYFDHPLYTCIKNLIDEINENSKDIRIDIVNVFGKHDKNVFGKHVGANRSTKTEDLEIIQ
jgi:hypothetical protein